MKLRSIPLTASGPRIHAKLALPVFHSVWGDLLKLSFSCSLRMPRSPRRQGISAVKSPCVVQSVNILTVHDAIIGQVICNFLCINLVPWINIYVLSLEAASPFLNASKKNCVILSLFIGFFFSFLNFFLLMFRAVDVWRFYINDERKYAWLRV